MTFLADLRIAARLLRRSPAFSIVSILTLALSIGATTSIYSVIEPVLLRALPYPSPDRLVVVTLAACVIPATRAARVDPSRALRSE